MRIGNPIPIGAAYASTAIWLQAIATLILFLCSFNTSLRAQVCPLDTLTISDTMVVHSALGACEVTTAEFFEALGISTCTNAFAFPTGPYTVGNDRVVNIFDQASNQIVSTFVLIIAPLPISEYASSSASIHVGDSFIEFPLAAGETMATKEMLLDQLQVVQNDVIRSQIQLYNGNARITNFSIGDTTLIDSVRCNGIVYYRDLKVLFTPQVPTFRGRMDFDIGLSTCKVPIEDVLARLGYDMNDASADRFRISHLGPFGYGDHLIQSIYLDSYLLLDRAVVSVTSAQGPRFTQDFGMLAEGQCFLNEQDLTSRLGIDAPLRDCNLSHVSYDPPGPFRDTVTTIHRIIIDGVPVWTNPFDVRYQQNVDFVESQSLNCNDKLNISMDQNCEVSIDADDILQGQGFCHLNYDIMAAFESTPTSVIYEGTNVKILYPGTYQVTITNSTRTNSCWSLVTIEDKYIADISATSDTVNCFDLNHLIPDTVVGGGPDFPQLPDNAVYRLTQEPRVYDVLMDNPCAISTASYVDQVVAECQDEFRHVIDRLWTFADPYDNTDTCTQRIYIKTARIDLIDNFQRYVADCIEDFDVLDSNGWPHPAETGYPTIDKIHDASICGNLRLSYDDTPFSLCGNSVQLARRWTVLDWCSDEVRYLDQIIQIEDRTPPQVVAPLEDFTLASDPFLCGQVNIQLPQPQLADCSDDVSIRIYYETINAAGLSVMQDNGSSMVIPELLTTAAAPSFQVIYVMTDACGNSSRDTLSVRIEDKAVPSAVCNQNTTVSVGGNGEAQVGALTFDDLSVDNCGISQYMIRKINGDCYLNEAFAETVKFCCTEIGEAVQVELQVEDMAGNKNTCLVNVFVQDKFRPQITCPDSIKINCGMDHSDLALTGMATFRDNCGGASLTHVDSDFLNTCGEGYIRRLWEVTDKGQFKASCSQIISIVEEQAFGQEYIDFPTYRRLNGCMDSLDPAITGSPVLSPQGCASVDASHEDKYFYNVTESCYRILREWTVVDWCQLNPLDPSAGFWTDVQIIDVNSELGPIIAIPDAERLCITDNQCALAVQLTATAVDGDLCTPSDLITWTYGLWHADSGQAIKAGASSTVSAGLQAGAYYVIYTAQDQCANMTQDTMRFEIMDCSSPRITCPPIQPTLVLDPQGQATLDINDLDASISDNCSPQGDLTLSFDPQGLIRTMDFNCNDLTDGREGMSFLSLFVQDPGGNLDSCQLFLLLKDNSGDVCQDDGGTQGTTGAIEGLITTEEGIVVNNVDVHLLTDGGLLSMRTGADGRYSFGDLQIGDAYDLTFSKKDDPMDGVATSDIVMIQRHLLGLTPLATPYKVIAADADNNGRVSSADLIVIRKLLLGKALEFDGGQDSWRFVAKSQIFNNLWSPFPFTEKLFIYELDQSISDADFMAIKIGDVNGSNALSRTTKSKSRQGHVTIEVAREDDKLVFRATQKDLLTGIQMALQLHDAYTFILEPGILDIGTEHIGHPDDNNLMISWSTVAPLSVEAGDILFTLDMNTPTNGLRDISINREIPTEWINKDIHVSSIQLRRAHDPTLTPISISNVSPNPWNTTTRFSLYLMEDREVDIEVIELSGRRLYHERKYRREGEHVIQLNASDIGNPNGLLILRITSGDHQFIQRMTILR